MPSSRSARALAPLGFGLLIEPLGRRVVEVPSLLSRAALRPDAAPVRASTSRRNRIADAEAPDNDAHGGLAGPATALPIIATDMPIMVTTIMVIMVMIGMMTGADEQQRGGDDRAGHDHYRHLRHQRVR